MTSSLPRRTYLYFTAQSVNLTTAVMSVTMAAIVGSALSPEARFSTLPYGFQFLFLMLATYPASKLMSRIGRKKAFMLGSIPLAVSGISGFWAVNNQHFPLLVVSHSALGIYIAFANFNRFAATDNLDQKLKPKALSLVVAGGVIAAVVGPTLIELLRNLGGYPLFSLCYASFIGLAALSLSIAAFLPDDPVMPTIVKANVRPVKEHKHSITPSIMVAMAVAAVGYGIMNLLMIQASMHMKHMHQDFSDVRLAIQWHVIAMFAPSFFTGAIIQKLGVKITICFGVVMLIGCAAINMLSSGYGVMIFSLIVLGLGWNLTYVGGGALLAHALNNNPRSIQLQGKNDLVIAVFATIGAFTPSILMSSVGWSGTNAICIVLSIMLLAVTISLLSLKLQLDYP
ncbi:MFS transporter [Pseudomonas syringae group genomosp. 3]|uniref:Membrane protein n=1 Tax=Pseudomonas syringae pv. persicae TaxID=237306 RepID=A0AB38EN84_9PSED|nr:MFS transporter [Pseudomonas syringae group genomosp. 3]SOQ09837.1 membrane protein [Pseudomonas syringae pv. persicae]SOQ16555.1 membrane protein [Pseudomonas syringae pv. persicae]